MKRTKRILLYILSASVIFASFSLFSAYPVFFAQGAEAPQKAKTAEQNWTEKQALTAEQATCGEGAELTEAYENSTAPALLLTDDGSATWSFTAESDGFCEISVTYITADAVGGDLEIAILLDGEAPSAEFAGIQLKRLYTQEAKFRTTRDGDDISPAVTEAHRWQTKRLTNTAGTGDALRLEVKKGTHTLELQGSRGSLAITEITLEPGEELPDYKEYSAENSAKKATAPIILEGEHFDYKNDTTIRPSADTSSPNTSPASFPERKLNTVGGSGWKQPGSTVTWEIDVPEDGLYALDIRFKQSYSSGIYVSRRLLIDDKIPFREASAIRFDNRDNWQIKRISGENEPYLLYLTEGPHTIALEAVMGDTAALTAGVEESLNTLNGVYREIVMITGVSPDIYRDYHFENLIPEELEEMERIYDSLKDIADEVKSQAGVSGSYTSIIQKLLFQLNAMTTEPANIAKYLTQFKSNLGALGTWLLSAKEQPLQIDILWLTPPDEPVHTDKSGFIGGIVFQIKQFFNSFFKDYANIGISSEAVYDKRITVWMQSNGVPLTGRDNAEILRQLVDNDFSIANRTEVNLQLVTSGTVLQSVLAGRGPDVALNAPSSEPINFAIRGAVLDLAEFSDLETVASQFFPAAVEPFRFDGHVYALPEYFTFPMFFYRTDIFRELKLSIPKSWDEILLLIPELQGKGLSMAMPIDVEGYAFTLYQNEGELYKNNGAQTNLDSNIALNSFKEYTELFTLHDLPVQYDFANRFRTGEMPCGITDYTLYNKLSVFAPEIRGHWEMVPVPGKLQADGSVSHAAAGTSGGSMIMLGTKDKQASWEFIKWWLSAKTQSQYGRDLESILGAAGKYATANREAISKMTWTSREYKNLINQAEQARAIPQVPGSYYLARVVDFAFNRSYNSSSTTKMAEDPIEVLRDYIVEFNEELTRKRGEFGLD